MLRLITRNIGDKAFDFEGREHLSSARWNWHDKCDFAFDTSLVVCLRDDIKDGELQVSFEGSLSLQLQVKGV